MEKRFLNIQNLRFYTELKCMENTEMEIDMTFWILSFIVEMLEVKEHYIFGYIYGKREGKYRNRYGFLAYCVVFYLLAITGIWIGMFKCIPIILGLALMNLAYYNVSFRQSFLFSIISYVMMAMIDYIAVALSGGAIIQGKWFLQALISKTVWIILLLFIRKFIKTRKSYSLITGK